MRSFKVPINCESIRLTKGKLWSKKKKIFSKIRLKGEKKTLNRDTYSEVDKDIKATCCAVYN